LLSIDSTAESLRSTCGSDRGVPDCSRQRFPGAAPHVGQGTDNNCFVVSSLFFIYIGYGKGSRLAVFPAHCSHQLFETLDRTGQRRTPPSVRCERLRDSRHSPPRFQFSHDDAVVLGERLSGILQRDTSVIVEAYVSATKQRHRSSQGLGQSILQVRHRSSPLHNCFP
jgi:hypothetical protein